MRGPLRAEQRTEVTLNRRKLPLNFRLMGEKIRTIIRWLSSLHSPLGRWAPLAASALLIGSRFIHFGFIRMLASTGALILVALTAADIIRSFIDTHSFPHPAKRANPPALPIIAVRVFLTFGLAGLYTALVFVGLGPWMNPLFLVPLIFVVCCAVAWRNLSLWYQEGEEFEEALAEVQHHQDTQAPQISHHQAH
jgi:hypothetical protein